MPRADLQERVAGLVVRLAARLVPRSARRRWLAEWRAELRHLEARRTGTPGTSPLRRSLGSVPDALWIRCHSWSPDMLMQDLRFALRSFGRSPAVTAVALVTLALGIGANTAVFSVVHGILVSPLPYAEPDRLMTVWLDNRLQGWPRDVTSYPNFVDWEEGARTFESMAAWTFTRGNVTGEGEPERLRGVQATPDLLEVLGVEPALGRSFSAADWRRDESVVVLSHGLWQRRFGGSPEVLEADLRLDDESFRVIGVMPPGFTFGDEQVVYWRPFSTGVRESSRGQLWLRTIGRLRSGVGIDEARADMATVGRRLEREYPEFNEGYGVNVVPLRQEIVGDVRPALLLLLGAVGLVLLIACGNVGSLMLVRASARRREIAVRAALGAGHGRLVRQMLSESLLLALAGGAVGTLVAVQGVGLLRRLGPELPRLAQIGIDLPVLGFALLLSCATGLLFGTVPALRSSRRELADALRDRGAGAAAGGHRGRALLVAAQIALALILLVGAGLLVRSYAALVGGGPGFDADQLLGVRLSLTGPEYAEGSSVRAFHSGLLRDLEARPAVVSAAAVRSLPLGSSFTSGPITVEGRPAPSRSELLEVKYNTVTPGYFATMGIPVVAGRELRPDDDEDAEPVIVINETMARHFFPDEDPVGRRLLPGLPDDYATENDPDPELPWWRIVGVVGDVRQRALDRPVEPEVFVPFAMDTSPAMTVVVRTDGDPATLAGTVRTAVRNRDAHLPLADLRALDRHVARSTSTHRFNLLLLGLFAGLAALLAVVGIYGVISQWITRQRHDIGVRMALGASSRDVLRMVLRRSLAVTGAGLLTGLLGALLLTDLMSGLLYGIERTDPLTYAAATLLLGAVALATGLLPARHAARIDPVRALGEE